MPTDTVTLTVSATATRKFACKAGTRIGFRIEVAPSRRSMRDDDDINTRVIFNTPEGLAREVALAESTTVRHGSFLPPADGELARDPPRTYSRTYLP